MFYADLPHINAILNSCSAALLISGYILIRRKHKRAHRAFMLAAFTASILFLISYLVYHAHAGSVRFQGPGWVRPLYFTVLISHSILAAAVVPLVIMALSFALKEKWDRHRRIARWTFPIWLYVSITGVMVYWMLYQL